MNFETLELFWLYQKKDSTEPQGRSGLRQFLKSLVTD
jgi:hypothetical protein